MRSKEMLVRCGLVAVLVMSTFVSAAPNPGQLWPSLANSIASLEATQFYGQVAAPKLDDWAVDWHGRVWLWLSCSTPGAVMRYSVGETDPQWYSPICTDVLIVTGTGTVRVEAFKDGMYPSDILVITIY